MRHNVFNLLVKSLSERERYFFQGWDDMILHGVSWHDSVSLILLMESCRCWKCILNKQHLERPFDFGPKIIPALIFILARNSIMHASCVGRSSLSRQSYFRFFAKVERNGANFQLKFFLSKTKNRTLFEKCRSKGHRIWRIIEDPAPSCGYSYTLWDFSQSVILTVELFLRVCDAITIKRFVATLNAE